ncbi:hypothetical protein DPMN_171798 [Dreissena polymorpha]|uniref:NACHT domain-containing protein n=1 Tax=Dreissena polymorpha TaxID=45954 RepID=A0A9D4ICR3_DREPO|nr:hypothetical protein DPMN_171798 [Dreissena polymorpha]
MAADTNIFTDKQTNNWFKACIALNLTKDGLTDFVVTELLNVQTKVGRSCGQCFIQNLILCPTHYVCKKRKGNNCSFHNSQQPKSCQTCDKVKQDITLLHRFIRPSWENTKAELWARNPWEIGKCYLPPDGYSSVSSVQESDFNGVVSVVLNCKHFETCLSVACLSPPPPDKKCPLEKVRQIGRDVRHTADCKVTDADLQYFFLTLTTLLADPVRLLHDTSATEARRKLSDLQNDRLSLDDLGKLLKEASQTLTQAKEAGEHFSKEAERTLREGLNTLEATIQAGKDRIENQTQAGEKRIEIKTQESINLINRTVIEKDQDEYERGVAELIEGMKKLYNDKLYYVTVSPFDDSSSEKLRDVYMPPKILEMCMEKKTFKKTEKKVNTYKGVFLTDNTVNPRIFIQGEAGSGKTTFLAKLALDWCEGVHGSSASDNSKIIFADFDTLQRYEYVFHITLRNSVNQCDVYTMIKEQIIDRIYSDKDREKAYELVSEIMKHQRCLVLLDGLDEWTGPGDLPTLVVVHNKCVMLITTRPWKLAEGKVKHSDIHALLQLEGINKPFELSKIILSRLVDREELEIKYTAFTLYVKKQKLEELLSSPMMLSAIVCAYADGIELKGSKCEIYILLVESLFKKASSYTRTFQQPPFPFFKRTEYIQPNLEPLNRLAEMAFHLLFVNDKENSIMFRMTELEKFKIDDIKDFALKSGILSAQRTASALRSSSSFMFIHLSMQEFLAAYHIARNTNLIDGSISVYLNRHSKAYLDIAQVFIFLCGLDVSCAEKLSSMMDERDALDTYYRSSSHERLNEIILAGLREANANGYSDIALKLSHFIFDNNNIIDLHKIWENNAANAIVLKVDIDDRKPLENPRISPGNDECASQITFDLHSCLKLARLLLSGRCILGKDSASVGTLEFPVCIILNIADPTQCTELPPVLPSIEGIRLTRVTCSCTWLRSLLSIMLTQNCYMYCMLFDCHLTACGEGEVNTSYTTGNIWLTVRQNKSILISLTNDTGLWEILHGLSIKSLRLGGWEESGCRVNHEKSFSQTIASLSKLETLDIKMDELTPCLWEALRGLNIKSLTLSSKGWGEWHAESLTQLLSSLKRLETLDITMKKLTPCLWEALHGLNIKSLTLSSKGWGEWHAESLTQSLSSLKRLETLDITMKKLTPCLWEALHGLNIKSLTLSSKGWEDWHAESLTQSLSSLKSLETLDITMDEFIPCLWKALYGLNIQSLTLSSKEWGKLHAESLNQSPASLKRLETLYITMKNWTPCLWEALHGLNIKSLRLDGLKGKGLKINHSESLSQSLSSLMRLQQLHIRVDEDITGFWEAFYGLNIKKLRVCGKCRVKYKESLSRSLSSLTQLETLSISADEASPGLWEALQGLSVKSLALNGQNKDFELNDTKLLSQSLSSLTQLEALHIIVWEHSTSLWEVLHTLNIKSLSLNLGYIRWTDLRTESLSQSLASLTRLETLTISGEIDRNGLWAALHGLNIKSLGLRLIGKCRGLPAESLYQSLSSLTQLDTLCFEGGCDCPGLWEAAHGLNIKRLSLSGLRKHTGIDVKHAVSLSNTLASLTQLETLSIDVEHESPGLWAALHGMNIKSLSLNGVWEGSGIDVKHAKTFSQSLMSLTQLETLTLHVHTYIALQVPQSLKNLNIYYDTMLPSELRELVDSLATCTHTIESKLEFGCARSIDHPEGIPIQEYIPVQQELAAWKNDAVKRFRIYEWPDSAGHAMSVRDIGDVDDAASDILEDDVYKRFAKYIDRYKINRISILIEISPGSIS